jgi:hypothetical protein
MPSVLRLKTIMYVTGTLNVGRCGMWLPELMMWTGSHTVKYVYCDCFKNLICSCCFCYVLESNSEVERM